MGECTCKPAAAGRGPPKQEKIETEKAKFETSICLTLLAKRK
jgi:hypothetical protein